MPAPFHARKSPDSRSRWPKRPAFLSAVFEGGKRTLALAHAAKQLQELTGACRAAAYNALVGEIEAGYDLGSR